jgi:hypothetical protein
MGPYEASLFSNGGVCSILVIYRDFPALNGRLSLQKIDQFPQKTKKNSRTYSAPCSDAPAGRQQDSFPLPSGKFFRVISAAYVFQTPICPG